MSKTDYSKISKKSAEEVTVDVTPETPEAPAPAEPILGKVQGCTQLNVRENPDIFAKVVLVIGKDSDVLINLEESTDDWYKVYVEGYDGFCMKKYVSLVQ